MLYSPGKTVIQSRKLIKEYNRIQALRQQPEHYGLLRDLLFRLSVLIESKQSESEKLENAYELVRIVFEDIISMDLEQANLPNNQEFEELPTGKKNLVLRQMLAMSQWQEQHIAQLNCLSFESDPYQSFQKRLCQFQQIYFETTRSRFHDFESNSFSENLLLQEELKEMKELGVEVSPLQNQLTIWIVEQEKIEEEALKQVASLEKLHQEAKEWATKIQDALIGAPYRAKRLWADETGKEIRALLRQDYQIDEHMLNQALDEQTIILDKFRTTLYQAEQAIEGDFQQSILENRLTLLQESERQMGLFFERYKNDEQLPTDKSQTEWAELIMNLRTKLLTITDALVELGTDPTPEKIWQVQQTWHNHSSSSSSPIVNQWKIIIEAKLASFFREEWMELQTHQRSSLKAVQAFLEKRHFQSFIDLDEECLACKEEIAEVIDSYQSYLLSLKQLFSSEPFVESPCALIREFKEWKEQQKYLLDLPQWQKEQSILQRFESAIQVCEEQHPDAIQNDFVLLLPPLQSPTFSEQYFREIHVFEGEKAAIGRFDRNNGMHNQVIVGDSTVSRHQGILKWNDHQLLFTSQQPDQRNFINGTYVETASLKHQDVLGLRMHSRFRVLKNTSWTLKWEKPEFCNEVLQVQKQGYCSFGESLKRACPGGEKQHCRLRELPQGSEQYSYIQFTLFCQELLLANTEEADIVLSSLPDQTTAMIRRNAQGVFRLFCDGSPIGYSRTAMKREYGKFGLPLLKGQSLFIDKIEIQVEDWKKWRDSSIQNPQNI